MKTIKVLGMMSGTSLDGLDLALCHFSKSEGKWSFSIVETKAIAYNLTWKNRLKHAIHLSDEDHNKLDQEYGTWLGKQAKRFLEDAREVVHFIASHGHTSHHRPEEGFTFQLGNGQALANTSGQKVICDFRTADVKLGGQGAPLVPIGDHLLFGEYDFCLNLGGISNVSFVKEGSRKALDIGMANMPLNHITQKVGLEYDENGQLARIGNLLPKLKTALDNLEYYTLPYPKSTGYEWFLADVVPLIENSEGSIPDLLHTIIHHNCEQIALEIDKFRSKSNNTLFVTGGGAFNSFFMETLQQKLRDSYALKIPSKTLIAFKEALVFALMGVLRDENQTNIFASVTGASQDSCSGRIYLPE